MASSSPTEAPVRDIVSFRIALKGTLYLYCSLHKVEKPSQLAVTLKEDNYLALINARRLINLNQVYNAANQSALRRNPTWDTVFNVAASSHLGHVLKDYAFLSHDSSNGTTAAVEGEQPAMVVVFQLVPDNAADTYRGWLKHYGLVDSMMPDICEYFDDRLANKAVQKELKLWYKLTDQEIEIFSLESCILTKIATKMI